MYVSEIWNLNKKEQQAKPAQIWIPPYGMGLMIILDQEPNNQISAVFLKEWFTALIFNLLLSEQMNTLWLFFLISRPLNQEMSSSIPLCMPPCWAITFISECKLWLCFMSWGDLYIIHKSGYYNKLSKMSFSTKPCLSVCLHSFV